MKSLFIMNVSILSFIFIFFPLQINHNFEFNNTHFEVIDHPRWGLIQGVVANRDIKAGEELFGYYGYKSQTFPEDFPWYYELKRKVEQEQRLKASKNKKSPNKKDVRKARKNGKRNVASP